MKNSVLWKLTTIAMAIAVGIPQFQLPIMAESEGSLSEVASETAEPIEANSEETVIPSETTEDEDIETPSALLQEEARDTNIAETTEEEMIDEDAPEDALMLLTEDAPMVLDLVGTPLTEAMKNSKGLITLTAGDYYLDSDLTADISISGVTASLDLNGHTLTGNGTANVISVASSGVFDLYDSSTDGTGVITKGETVGSTSAVSVSKSTFNMHGGNIQGNNTTNAKTINGAGVSVIESTFTMTGGAIKDNKGVTTAGTGLYYDNGGGLYISGKSSVNLEKGLISGNSAGTGGGIYVKVTGDPVKIGKEMVISENVAAKSNNFSYGGGGLAVMGGTVEIDGALLSKNYTYGNTQGGAIFCKGGNLIIKNAEISENYTKDPTSSSYGLTGGIHIEKNNSIISKVTIENTNIIKNKGTGAAGGIYIKDSELNLTDCHIDNNTSDNKKQGGGGLTVQGSSTGTATVTMTGGTINNNSAARLGGGGVYVSGATALFTMKSGEISGNIVTSTSGYGGGVCLSTDGKMDMQGGTIKDNTSKGEGGGIWMSTTSTLKIADGCEITGNTAASNGGGIETRATENSIIMTGGKITGNTSGGTGGGLHFQGKSLTMSGNVQITDNTAKGTDSNLYLRTGKIITVGTDGLSSDAKIGVTVGALVTATNPVNITDSTEDFTKNFVSDTGYKVSRKESGEIYLECINLEEATLTVADAVYTGSALTPVYTLTLPDGNEITTGTVFNETYLDNINAGTGTLTLTAKTGTIYKNSVSGTFKISPKTIVDATTIEAENAFVYDGMNHSAEFAVTDIDRSAVLVKDTDYTVTGADWKNTGELNVTFKGIGNYTGEVTKTFTIAPKELTGDMFAVAKNPVYNGSLQKPTITAMDGSIVLEEAVDYTIAGNEAKEPGTYTMTITGKGNYTGSVTLDYEITKPVAGIIEVPENSPERITGISSGMRVKKGTVLTITADEFIVDGVKYVPLRWQVNPEGIFVHTTDVVWQTTLYTSEIEKLGAHEFHLYYRVMDGNGEPTGQLAERIIPFTVYEDAKSSNETNPKPVPNTGDDFGLYSVVLLSSSLCLLAVRRRLVRE